MQEIVLKSSTFKTACTVLLVSAHMSKFNSACSILLSKACFRVQTLQSNVCPMHAYHMRVHLCVFFFIVVGHAIIFFRWKKFLFASNLAISLVSFTIIPKSSISAFLPYLTQNVFTYSANCCFLYIIWWSERVKGMIWLLCTSEITDRWPLFYRKFRKMIYKLKLKQHIRLHEYPNIFNKLFQK